LILSKKKNLRREDNPLGRKLTKQKEEGRRRRIHSRVLCMKSSNG
jgi:hypothetical protein